MKKSGAIMCAIPMHRNSTRISTSAVIFIHSGIRLIITYQAASITHSSNWRKGFGAVG
jgi:hypothetical protein